MNRPILIACTGYIIGIIIGLYNKLSIVLLFFIIILLFTRKSNRYVKTIFKIKVIIIFCISAIISFGNIQIQENTYSKLYEIPEKLELTATVVSDKKEKEYSNTYKLQVKTINGNKLEKNLHILLKVKKDTDLNYGDLIKVSGKYIKPSKSRNYNGYDYQQYLKTQQTFGTIETTKTKIEILKENQVNLISKFANIAKNSIISQTKKILPEDTYGMLCGILIGDKTKITDDVIQSFKDTNLSHILAISGLHVSYVMLRSSLYTAKNKFSQT